LTRGLGVTGYEEALADATAADAMADISAWLNGVVQDVLLQPEFGQ
jgi:hypothetical protein